MRNNANVVFSVSSYLKMCYNKKEVMRVNIWDGFEIPTFDDRQNLPQADNLSRLRIEESELGLDPTSFCLAHPRLRE